MGLSRAQLKQRAEQRLTEYLTTHGTKLADLCKRYLCSIGCNRKRCCGLL